MPRLLSKAIAYTIVAGVAVGTGGIAWPVYSPKKSNEAILNPSTFTSFSLKAKEHVSSTSSIFHIQQDGLRKSETLKLLWDRAIWSIEIKQPQLQIARAYTPLPPSQDGPNNNQDELRLLIRKEQGGEVSTYLHKLPEDATIDLRGPHVECEIPENTHEVVFLAGGTGIAPALQVAHILRDRPDTRMTILWASRKHEDCEGAQISSGGFSSGWTRWLHLGGPQKVVSQESAEKSKIVQQLDQLTTRSAERGSSCSVEYFVDEEKKLITSADVTKHVHPSLSDAGAAGSRIIFVSGPDGFIDYWAGKKVWMNGEEAQGPLGGMLSRLNLTGWSVWKL